jgi:hypothetical protein
MGDLAAPLLEMPIRLDGSGLRSTKWHEYATRFLFGGLITAGAGLISKQWGPVVGGLFLAFPAIFPASVTLIEKHERQKKEKEGLQGSVRGRKVASLEAAGSAMGSVGLLAFALLAWQFLPTHSTWLLLGGSTVIWLLVSVSLWYIRKRL